MTLEAVDKARNKTKHKVAITVDNTLPKAEIWSLNGSFLRGMVIVRLHAEDANFYRMELEIGEETMSERHKRPNLYGFPWLIIILAIFTVLASTSYYVRKRKRGATATNYSPQQVSCSHLSHVKAASILIMERKSLELHK